MSFSTGKPKGKPAPLKKDAPMTYESHPNSGLVEVKITTSLVPCKGTKLISRGQLAISLHVGAQPMTRRVSGHRETPTRLRPSTLSPNKAKRSYANNSMGNLCLALAEVGLLTCRYGIKQIYNTFPAVVVSPRIWQNAVPEKAVHSNRMTSSFCYAIPEFNQRTGGGVRVGCAG